MTQNPWPEVENIIKDIRNLFRQEKETRKFVIILTDIKNLFGLEKEEEN